MRGKKVDNEFVIEFIENCTKDGIFDKNKISLVAQEKINEIDNKIIEVEKLKKIRSKLVDVVITLKK